MGTSTWKGKATAWVTDEVSRGWPGLRQPSVTLLLPIKMSTGAQRPQILQQAMPLPMPPHNFWWTTGSPVGHREELHELDPACGPDVWHLWCKQTNREIEGNKWDSIGQQDRQWTPNASGLTHCKVFVGILAKFYGGERKETNLKG